MSILQVQYVTNATAGSGVGHQAEEIAARLERAEEVALMRWQIDGEAGKLLRDEQQVAQINPWPGALGSKSVNWVRLGPKIPHPSPEAEGLPLRQGEKIYHLTNQTLAFLAKSLQPAVITVHDIIELLEPQDRKAYWLNKYLYSGMTQAARVICVSEYTKQTVQEYYGISDDKLTVIHNGVGRDFFSIEQFEHTLAAKDLRHKLKIPTDAKIVLYVGSDHPRKNVIGAVQAFTRAMKQVSAPMIFIKVGAAGLPAGRARLLEVIDEFGIREQVRIQEDVSVEELNELYNLADVLIFPSCYEGFGLPPLQAMAAGTPVVTSNSTSLPEIVGQAALTYSPDDVDGFTRGIVSVLLNSELAATFRAKGLQRAAHFSWETAARRTLEVYHSLRS